jgi:hypothetical protein
MKRVFASASALAFFFAGVTWLAFAANKRPDPRNDIQLRAMLDEIARSKTLQISNLDKP